MLKKRTKRLTLDFDEKAYDRLAELVGERGTTKAETIRAALALLGIAMGSDDKTVSLKKEGEVVKYLVSQ